MLDALVASEGEPDLVQISGGEPTIHPQILDIIAAARRRPIRHVMLNTNGIRIAEDPAFVDALAEFRPGFEVYLQFDSLNDDGAEEHPRRRRSSRIRRAGAGEARGAQHLDDAGLHGEARRQRRRDRRDRALCAATTNACAASPSSRSRMPAATRASIPRRNRIVLSEIRRRIVEDSGVFADGDMIPLPCNPASISIGYGAARRREGDPAHLAGAARGAAARGAQRDLLREVSRAAPALRRSAVAVDRRHATPPERLGSLLCCLPDVPMPEGSATRTSSASRSWSSSTASISASATSSAPASIS